MQQVAAHIADSEADLKETANALLRLRQLIADLTQDLVMTLMLERAERAQQKKPHPINRDENKS